MKQLSLVLTNSFIAIAPALAFAQGGLNSGTNAANNFQTWLYAFIGILAATYLTFKGVQLAGEKIQWIDFGYSILKVAVIGGVPALATWAWSVYA